MMMGGIDLAEERHPLFAVIVKLATNITLVMWPYLESKKVLNY